MNYPKNLREFLNFIVISINNERITNQCNLKTYGLDPESKQGANEHDRTYP